MAIASKNVVILELDADEAVFLSDLLAFVGGDAYNSRRKHADSIIAALHSVDVNYGERPADIRFVSGAYAGGVYFDEPEPVEEPLADWERELLEGPFEPCPCGCDSPSPFE